MVQSVVNTGSLNTPTQQARDARVLSTPIREEKVEAGVEDTSASTTPNQLSLFGDIMSGMDVSSTEATDTPITEPVVDERTVDENRDLFAEEEYERATNTGQLVVTPEQRAEGTTPRSQEEGRVDVWDFNQNYVNRSTGQRRKSMEAARQANFEVNDDGGLNARVINLADQVETGNIFLGGIGVNAKDNVALNVLNTINAIDPETRKPDRNFLLTVALVTEDSMATMAMQDGVEAFEVMDQDQGVFQGVNKKGQSVTKVIPQAQGRVQIGKRIHNEYQKMMRVENPVDISKEDAEALGSLAKELYFAANESDVNPIIELVPISRDGVEKQRGFRLTPYGETMLSAGTWKRAKAFPKDRVRPSKFL